MKRLHSVEAFFAFGERLRQYENTVLKGTYWRQLNVGRLLLKCDGTPRNQGSSFVRKGPVHLNRPVGVSSVNYCAAEVCASAVVMMDTPCSEVVWRVLATHCIRQFPLHFPSLASPCAITFQLYSNRRIQKITVHCFLWCMTACKEGSCE